ncbi:Membrane protein [Flavobacterium sp. 9AF]|uniref:DUF4126 domain-containing protein n=1 Tax=Flavobacterium sp. 9AF TaxID=2653142 RepID=UPI0012F3CDC1|nr:DUF4126 domain-containing protein [Flavobacterium sp. 9AF]VXA99502.1 Membrane protein [Flavobacterium sp. 9AF]
MVETIISICLGIGLAASAGFRVFVPLLILSIATYFDYVPVSDTFSWIGSITAIICLTIATIIEIMAYYIPYVDNLLDALAIPLASIAGTLVMASTMIDLDPMFTWGLAIIAGGGTAAAISTATTTTRATSTATTGGLANSIVSTTETATASFVSITAIFFPIIAFLVVIFIVIFGIKIFRKFFRK